MDRRTVVRFLAKSLVYRAVATVTELGFFFLWFRSWQLTLLLAAPVVVLNFVRVGGYFLFDLVWHRMVGNGGPGP